MSEVVKKAVDDLLAKAFPGFGASRNGAAFLAPLQQHYTEEFATAEKEGRLDKAVADAVARMREVGLLGR